MPARGRPVFYGWWMVGIALVVLTLMSATAFQGAGAFLVALERHFGWSRTVLSGAFVLGRLEGAVLGPVEGLLVDRLGPRRMFTIGYVVMALGFLLFSQVQEVWHFYVALMVILVGSGLGGWLPMVAAVNGWFIRRRTLAMALAMSGVHFGGFLVPLLVFGLDSFGFRTTTFGVGVVLLLFTFCVARFIRDRPERYGLRPDGEPPRAGAAADETGAPQPEVAAVAPQAPGARTTTSLGAAPREEEPDFTARRALRTPAFWFITATHMTSNLTVSTLSIHLLPKLTAIEGLSFATASLVVLAFTAVALPVQFASGLLGDRLPKQLAIFVFMIFQGSAILVLALADSIVWAYAFAVLYGIGFGGRIAPITAIRGEYFGRRAFGTILGLSMLPSSVAMIGAPLFAGRMFDVQGTYLVPFLVFGSINVLGGFLILFARRPRTVTLAEAAVPPISADAGHPSLD